MTLRVSALFSTLALLLMLPAAASAQSYGQNSQQQQPQQQHPPQQPQQQQPQQQQPRRQQPQQQPQDQNQGSGQLQGQQPYQNRQPTPLSPYAQAGKFYIGPLFGLGGEFEGDFIVKSTDTKAPLDSDMLNTLGGFMQYEMPVHRFVVIGGRGAIGSFITEGQDDDDLERDLLFNFDVIGKLRYAFADAPGEVYAGVPVGLSMILPSDDWEDKAEIETEMGVSWNMSVVGGFNYLLFGQFGVFGEAGWMLQNVAFDGELNSVAVEVEGSFSQFGLNLGVVIPM